MMKQLPTTKLIAAEGHYYKVCGPHNNVIAAGNTIDNPIAYGFYCTHKLFGDVLCIAMGEHKGIWIEEANVYKHLAARKAAFGF
jgi:hypothetical protein